MGFKKDFVWGAATASYQIEGAAFEDGKGLNIWDVHTHEGGRVFGDHTGDVACDSYHKLEEDIALLKEIGVKAYRFSVSWPRLLPEGTGAVNEKGIDYYNRLIDALCANGIEPYITLYHWDLPDVLQRRGGFMNKEIADWFYEYAKLIAERFSDRVSHFITINEPQCILSLGYYQAEHAPGLKMGKRDLFMGYYHLLLAHGMAVKALREFGKQPLSIGITTCGKTYFPESDNPEDIEAARYATFEMMGKDPLEAFWKYSLVMDPIYLGKYPDTMKEVFGELIIEPTPEEWELIHQPLEFYGQNIYDSLKVRAGKDGRPEIIPFGPGYPVSAMDWPVTPEGMYRMASFNYDRYKTPILVTENGMADLDWVGLDGKVHDPKRADYYKRYIKALRKAADEGADIAGYFAWSLMDNFEWAFGYNRRFGLVYVDYETGERTIKDSAYAYREIMESNGENL